MYARTNRCYNERGSRTNYVRSSSPHCTMHRQRDGQPEELCFDSWQEKEFSLFWKASILPRIAFVSRSICSVVIRLARVTSHSPCIVLYAFVTCAGTTLPLWYHSPNISVFSGAIFQNASLPKFCTYFFLSCYLVKWRAHFLLSLPLSQEYWVGFCLYY